MSRLRLLPYLLFLWQHRYTATGKSLFAVSVLAAMNVASLMSMKPIHSFFFLLLAMVMVDWLVGMVFRPRISASRRMPDRVAAGAQVEVAVEVTNRGPLGAYDLTIIEWRPPQEIQHAGEPEYVTRLAVGETTTLRRRLVATRRGVYDLTGPAVATAFPFGIYHKVKKLRSPHRLLVYPRFQPLSRLAIPAGRKHQPGGLQLVSAVGDSEEFLGNREYRPGDRLRDVDHRAWARRGYPVVREHQQEYLTRIALVIDTYVDRRGKAGHRDFEAAVSLAAAVADALSRQEYVVDVFAAGPDLYHFQAGRSLAYLDNILDVLACLEPCRRRPFAAIGPSLVELLESISTAVLVYLDWDDDRHQLARRIRDRNVAVLASVVRSAPTTGSPAGFVSEAGPVRVFTAAEVERGVDEL